MASIMRVRTKIAGYVGAPGLATYYFAGPGAPTSAEAQEAVDRVRAFWFAARNGLGQFVSLDVDPAVDTLDQATGLLDGGFGVTAPDQVLGQMSGGTTATSVMAVLTLNTNVIVRGRRLRGRSFLGPIGPGALGGNGQLTTTETGILLAATTAFTTTITEGISPVVWSRPKFGGDGTAAIVSGYSMSTKPGTLKSRRD